MHEFKRENQTAPIPLCAEIQVDTHANSTGISIQKKAWYVYLSLIYALVLLYFAGVTPTKLYSSSPFHTYQANAMLHGRFSLSDSIHSVRFDNAFYDGHVQQVWGLGVGTWLLPFELFGKIIGVTPFPDSIAKGVALFLFAYYCITTGERMRRLGFSTLLCFGTVVLLMLSTPLVTLVAKGLQRVYEDSSIYALLASQTILVAVLRYCLFSLTSDFWICCMLAAFSGFVRPTHAVYGACGVAILVFLRWGHNRKLSCVFGTMVFAAGMMLLLATNQIRFGSPFEFGHRLTMTTPDAVEVSRFINPVKAVSAKDAGMELFGALFFNLGDIHKMDDWGRSVFPWQSPCVRWRCWDITTYDPTHLFFLVAGFGIAGTVTISAYRYRRTTPLSSSKTSVALALLAWSATGTALTFGFLMYYPPMCSRYLYDFWPSFLGVFLIVWVFSASRMPRIACAILAVWYGGELFHAEIRHRMLPYVPQTSITAELEEATGEELSHFKGCYDREHPPTSPSAGPMASFWDKNTSIAGYVVMVPVDKPEFVELQVSPRLQKPGAVSRHDSYRARISNQELRLYDVRQNESTKVLTVRFEVPKSIREKAGDEFLSLCFISVADQQDWESHRELYSIKWRSP